MALKLLSAALEKTTLMTLIMMLVATPTFAQSTQAQPSPKKPTTLPSYPNQPAAERPRPRPPRPGTSDLNRPVILPSYPNRPQPGRPTTRPPSYRPNYRPQWGYQYPSGGQYFARTIRCESYSNRFRSCMVPTSGRVVLERRHNGRCRYGNGWGYDRSRIWVDNNCRATFAYGVGSYTPRYRSNNDGALVVGGIVVAAGLIAILSKSGNSSGAKTSNFTSAQTASIMADLDEVDPNARQEMKACLDRAAHNVGTTGGKKIELTAVTIDNMGNGSYRFDSDIRASYSNKDMPVAFSCTAKGDEVEDFDFISDE